MNTLRSRLIAAQAPLWIALILVSVISVYAVKRLGAESQLILQDNYRSVLAAERMKESLERIDSGAMYTLLARESDGRTLVETNIARFDAELRVQEGNITEPGESDATRELRRSWDAYLAAWKSFDAIPPGEARRENYFSRLQPGFVAVKNAADRILSINQDAMIQKSNAEERDAARVVAILISAALASMIAGAWGASALTTRILRPVNVLTQTVQRIGEGDLAVRAVVSGSDEIAQLAREFNALADSVAAYRKSSLGDLIQAQQASQAAIDSLTDPVIVFGAAGVLLAANRAAETLGVAAESSRPFERMHPSAREAAERAHAWVTSGKGAFVPRGYEDAVLVPSPEGETWLLPRATAIYTDVGIAGVTVVLQDVTRFRRFDELTRDLVATAAHEFRTPLTSLQMAIHLCLEQLAGPLTEKQADLLQAAREDCERLMDLVEDLLDVSRLHAGRAELKRVAMDPEKLVANEVESQNSSVDARKITVSTSVSPGLSINADPDRIRLVLANLLSNAIRHAKKAVSITVKETDPAVLRFEVIDDGPGIPAEWRARVFEKFVRVPGEKGGAGLGLHIAREIVAAHGGVIGVDEVSGGGTCFWFTVPRATA